MLRCTTLMVRAPLLPPQGSLQPLPALATPYNPSHSLAPVPPSHPVQVRKPQLFGAGPGTELKHYFPVMGVGLGWVAANGCG